MRKLHFLYKMQLELTGPVTEHAFVLRFVPQDQPCQKIELEHVRISPSCETSIQRDGFGNRLDVGEIRGEHRYFCYEAAGIAEVSEQDPSGKPEKLQMIYRFESPLTRADQELKKFYMANRPSEKDSLSRAVAMMKQVYEHMSYVPGSTSVRTSAAQAFAAGRGVCQDYAQILITLCRLDGIPARYTAGMMVGEGSSHAWVEIYVDGRWISLDPTHNCLADDRYIHISHGRDCGDCVVERGTFKGDVLQNQYVYVKVEEL